VTLQSSFTNLSQGRDQIEEQDEIISPTFYDLRTLFHKEQLSTFIPQGQISQDDQADNIPVTPSLGDQMQELQRRLAAKRPKSLISLLALKTKSEKEIMRLTVATQLSLYKISRS